MATEILYTPLADVRWAHLVEPRPQMDPEKPLAWSVDLLLPFRGFRYYHPQQHGSASMKAVLPALTGSGYEDLAIQEGGTASRSAAGSRICVAIVTICDIFVLLVLLVVLVLIQHLPAVLG